LAKKAATTAGGEKSGNNKPAATKKANQPAVKRSTTINLRWQKQQMAILGNLPSKSRTNHEFQWRQHAACEMKWQLLHLMAA